MPKKILKGKVVSNKMQKTVVVSVEMLKLHKIYKKQIKNTKRFKARADELINIGDEVMIEETPPFSKTVAWKVVKNLSKETK